MAVSREDDKPWKTDLARKSAQRREQVVHEVEELVRRKNQRLASFEQIKKFIILDREFSIEENELTPTLKLKRKVVTDKYRELLDSLYEVEEVDLQEDLALEDSPRT